MFTRHALFFIFTISFFRMFSQDAFFSNTNQSLIYLNPSFAGTNGFIRSQSAFRLQDNNSSMAFRTFYSAIDTYIRPANGAVAFSYINDNQAKGLLKSNEASVAYAQHIFLYNKKLRVIPSIQATYFMKELDLTRLQFYDTINPRKNYTITPYSNITGSPSGKRNFIEINASAIIQNKNVTIGVAVFHINQPNEGIIEESKLPLRINFHASYNLRLNEEFNLSFFGLIVSQKDFKDYLFNCNLAWDKQIFVGLGLRKTNALIMNIAFQEDSFRLSFGYDYGFSKSKNLVYGQNSFELMVSFNFKSRNSENRSTADWQLW